MAGARRSIDALLRLPTLSTTVKQALDSALSGAGALTCPLQIERLLRADIPDEVEAICVTADTLRKTQAGDEISFVVNRNINFTNVCTKSCGFCAFSRKYNTEQGYVLPMNEIVRRASEARQMGATEVCIQAGLMPGMNGKKYIELIARIKEAEPSLHIHAYSPEEVLYGVKLIYDRFPLQDGVRKYLARLREAGLDSLPGTSAEILDKALRWQISRGRISVEKWKLVIRTAHELGIPTTSTMMYGHAETPLQVANHLLLLQQMQHETRGFTEFVPLSFVSEQAPMAQPRFRTNWCHVRRGPSRRERKLVHAVSRIVLGESFRNVQVSWVKEGLEDAKTLLECGANDLGGTLMNESISTAAGAQHGQLQRPSQLRKAIRELGRVPVERSTTYGILQRFGMNDADDHRVEAYALDQVQENDDRFGSYSKLIRDSDFKFDKRVRNDFS